MKTSLNEKLIAYLALLSGLTISGVAVYYSVIGLTAIFAAATVPIIIMGVALELSKLVATVWLKQNWAIAPRSVRSYLMVAIITLMVITSMGIFGFLSKAHLDQNVPSGEVAAKLSIIDEKIKTQRENLEVSRASLKQLDDQVNARLSRGDSEQGAERAVQIRKQQAKERAQIQADITSTQKAIAKLNEERAPIASELRKVEAEVGPIKYIATFFYGTNDPVILEKAVTWVIIILIVVFDPLAVILLLASQISFENFRKRAAEESRTEWTEKDFEEIAKETFTEATPQPEIKEDSVQITTEKIVQPEATIIQPVEEEKIEPVNEIDKYAIPVKKVDTNRIKRKIFRREILPDPLGPIDYQNISEEKLQERISYYVQMVKERKISMSDVPKEILLQVRALV